MFLYKKTKHLSIAFKKLKNLKFKKLKYYKYKKLIFYYKKLFSLSHTFTIYKKNIDV